MPSIPHVFMRNAQVAWQTIDDKIVVVTPKTKKIHILYGTGGEIWTMLTDPQELSGVVEHICDHYDTDTATAKTDVEPFLHSLLEENIIVPYKDEVPQDGQDKAGAV